jgi:outer membrane protein OmpA-like peptidoglycan-associated protein/cell division protein FtsN
MKKNIYIIIIISVLSAKLLAQSVVPTNDKVMIINEKTINTDGSEYSPAFYENGIVFISTDGKSNEKAFDERQGKKSSSILRALRGPEGILVAPEVFAKKLTSSYNEGPVTFDRNNDNIFFSTNHQKKGKKLKAKDGLVKQKIQTAKRQGDSWSEPEDLPFNNVEFSVIHPSVSVDGNTLYFASNMPGGSGGMDLYICRKKGDAWGEAINLGKEINSEKDEVFPYVHPNGTLYFACNGRNSLGGLDIFSTRMISGKFASPENIGKPFNSENDDFGFILDLEGKNGYFSSNRAGGKGDDDIYSFTSESKIGVEPTSKPDRQLGIFIVNKVNASNIENAEIKMIPLSAYEIGDQVVDDFGNVIKLTSTDSTNILTAISSETAKILNTDNEGKVKVTLKDGDYLVNISKNGYQSKQTIFNVNSERDDYMVLLEPLQAESVPMTGVLKNNRGVPITNATITLTEENGKADPIIIKTDNNGNYKYYVKPNTNYILSATKDNHLAASTKINSTTNANSNGEMAINLEMPELTTPLPTGKVFQLNNVYYNYNDASLRPDAKKDLDPLVSLLKTYPEVEIELASHTDSRGDAKFNQTLSQRRAESVVKYLTDKGIARNRLMAMGYGESKPRNQCSDGVQCSEEEHSKNRRTEVRVTRGGNDLDATAVDNFFKGSTQLMSENADGTLITDATKMPNKNSNTAPTKTTNSGSTTVPSKTNVKPTKTTTTTSNNSDVAVTGTENVQNNSSTANNNTKTPSKTNVKPTKTPSTPSQNTKTDSNSDMSMTDNSEVKTKPNTTPIIKSTEFKGGAYWVVAGSYQKPENADEQISQLTAKGYSPVIVYAEDIRFYRVVVAYHNTLSEALSLMKKLRSQREPAFILRG